MSNPSEGDDFYGDATRPRPLFSGASGWVLTLCVLIVGLHSADALIVTTMMPEIVVTFGRAELLHLGVGLYEIGTVVGTASCALLLQRFGFRQVFSAGGTVFAIGCIAAVAAQSFGGFAVSRFMQGLGGGALLAMSFVAVRRCFSAERQAAAMAAVTTAWAISAYSGPLLGGLAVRYWSWQGPFAVFALVAAGLAGAGFASRSLDALDRRQPETRRLPIRALGQLGALFLGVSMLVLAGLEHASWRGALAMIGAFALALFFWLERQAGEDRLFPLGGRGAPRVLAGVGLLATGTISINIYLPYVLIATMGLSALQAGYVFALEALAWTVAAHLVARVRAARDDVSILTGCALVLASAVILVWAVSIGSIALSILGAISQGLGLGVAWAPLFRLACDLASEDDQTRASAAMPLAQRLGFVVGALALGGLAQLYGFSEPETLKRAAQIIFVASMVPTLLAAGLFLATIRSRTRR